MYQYHDTILFMYQVSVSWYFFYMVSISISWYNLKVSYTTLQRGSSRKQWKYFSQIFKECWKILPIHIQKFWLSKNWISSETFFDDDDDDDDDGVVHPDDDDDHNNNNNHNKKAVLSQGNRATPQLLFWFKVRRQHLLQVIIHLSYK